VYLYRYMRFKIPQQQTTTCGSAASNWPRTALPQNPPCTPLFDSPTINDHVQVSGEYLAKNGIATFACSETQKFGHVTFFWNGNRSGYFDSKLETYVEVGVQRST